MYNNIIHNVIWNAVYLDLMGWHHKRALSDSKFSVYGILPHWVRMLISTIKVLKISIYSNVDVVFHWSLDLMFYFACGQLCNNLREKAV